MQNYFIPTDKQLEKLFDEYNQQYFDGQLPKALVLTTYDKSFVGYYNGIEFDEDDNLLPPFIEISSFYLFTEATLRDTLLHEMLHLYASCLSRKPIRFTHHGVWKQKAEEFNSKYGFNITKYARMADFPKAHRTPIFKQRNFFQRIFMGRKRCFK